MKIQVSKELRARLAAAAANGSVVAGDILAEVRRRADVTEIIRGTANCFSTKRRKQNCDSYSKVKVVFTACTKDLTHPGFPDRGNPQAPWFPENRTDMEASTFVGYFKNLPAYDERSLAYFANAVCVSSRVSVKTCGRMQDFIDAYTAENYADTAQMGESSLHTSCMRHEGTARSAADFYHNFAGAKIIVAGDSAGYILGRAILWPDTVHKTANGEVRVGVLDRVYFTHDFVVRLIHEHAKKTGVHLRKQRNDYDSPREMTALNDIPPLGITAGTKLEDMRLYVPVTSPAWHKKGAPYMDTFYHVMVNRDKRILLSNTQGEGCFATCRESTGRAGKDSGLCPCCGKVHGNNHPLCEECYGRIFIHTPYGQAMACRTVEYNNERYPSILFRKGKPIDALNLYFQVEKLYRP